jgi:hypothetical protein
MKLPMVPPTNPPAYVGPLRISSSSVNSTVRTTNYMGYGQTGERSCVALPASLWASRERLIGSSSTRRTIPIHPARRDVWLNADVIGSRPERAGRG